MKQNGPTTILRWGIAFVFFYGALAALVWPEHSLVPMMGLFNVIFSLYELGLAGALFWGKRTPLTSLLATITFTILVIFDFRAMENIYPLIGLAFSSLALFDMSKQENTDHTNEHK
jgi:hypothetical protein